MQISFLHYENEISTFVKLYRSNVFEMGKSGCFGDHFMWNLELDKQTNKKTDTEALYAQVIKISKVKS